MNSTQLTGAECPDCAKAAAGVWHGFRAGCQGCCARATARGPNFARVRTTGSQDRQYRAQLQQFGLTHEQVKAAAAADFITGCVELMNFKS